VWKVIQGSCELNWTSTANGKGGRLVLQLERENRGKDGSGRARAYKALVEPNGQRANCSSKVSDFC
jgi:hypothetical protein